MKEKGTAAKKIVTAIVVGGMVAIFLFDIVSVVLSGLWEKRFPPTAFSLIEGEAAGRIHFLNTDNSDCILLESRGHFALIDSGWGSDNPNEHALKPGYEPRVLEYLKRTAAEPDGRVTLDFVLPTHYHYDHAGGFPRILADPALDVGTVYLRHLRGDHWQHELESWGVDVIRRDIEQAAQARDFKIETNLPDKPFRLGDMTIRLLNLEDGPKGKGENDNSVVLLIECAGKKALLTGDVTAMHGLEQEIGRQAGPVDIIKLGHHGYSLSNSLAFLRAAQPQLAVVTNGIGKVYPNVRWNVSVFTQVSLYSSVSGNGAAVTITGDGKIWVTENLHRQ